MFHSVKKFFCSEYVDVQMVSTLREVSVHNIYQVVNAFLRSMSDCIRVDGLGVRDSVKCPFVRQLGNGVQGSKKSVLFCTVAWVCSR